MRLMRTIAMMGLAGSILMGCASTKSNTVINVPIMDQNENLAVWQAATPNPLMYYVPNDAPFVFITQRNQDMHNPGLRTIYEILLEAVPFREIRRATKSYERYNRTAKELGLNPDGQFDAALYFYDYYAVLHITADAAHTTMMSLHSLIKDKYDDTTCIYKYTDDKFVRECQDELTISETPGWSIYQLSDLREHLSLNIAMHYSTNVLSIVVYDKDHPLPEKVLSGSPAPFEPRTLDNNAVFVSRILPGNLAEFLFKQPLIAKMIDEEYWDEDDDVYGFVQPEQKKALCEKENLTVCGRWWNRTNTCKEESKSHCPKPEINPPEECTDCEKCSCLSTAAAEPEYDPDDDDYLNDCSWYSSCYECARYDDCWSALTHTKQMSVSERLKAIGYTSISDDVCINETKALLADTPAVEMEAVVTVSGAIGLKFSVQSTPESIKSYRSMILEHAEVDENDAQIKGFFALDNKKFLDKVLDDWNQKLGQTKHDCTQLQAMESIRKHSLARLSSEMDLRYWTVFSNMGAVSLVIKRLALESRRDEYPVFWGYIENTPLMLQMIASEIITDINDETDDPQYLKYEVSGNKLVFATSPFDPKATKYKMVKDNNTFSDVRVRYDLIDQLVSRDLRWLISNYHLYFGLNQNDDMVFSIMPE